MDADPEGRDAPLPKSEARLVALSSAIAAGDPDPIATSVKMGGTRARVRESIALCAPTAGAATVSEALRVAGLESQDARG